MTRASDDLMHNFFSVAPERWNDRFGKSVFAESPRRRQRSDGGFHLWRSEKQSVRSHARTIVPVGKPGRVIEETAQLPIARQSHAFFRAGAKGLYNTIGELLGACAHQHGTKDVVIVERRHVEVEVSDLFIWLQKTNLRSEFRRKPYFSYRTPCLVIDDLAIAINSSVERHLAPAFSILRCHPKQLLE